MQVATTHRRPQLQGVAARPADEPTVPPQTHVHRKRTPPRLVRTMHRAGTTPLVPTPNRRLVLQLPQDVSHHDPLTEQLEVYAGHRLTSSSANTQQEPGLKQ